jgi:hypothetical protein
LTNVVVVAAGVVGVGAERVGNRPGADLVDSSHLSWDVLGSMLRFLRINNNRKMAY